MRIGTPLPAKLTAGQRAPAGANIDARAAVQDLRKWAESADDWMDGHQRDRAVDALEKALSDPTPGLIDLSGIGGHILASAPAETMAVIARALCEAKGGAAVHALKIKLPPFLREMPSWLAFIPSLTHVEAFNFLGSKSKALLALTQAWQLPLQEMDLRAVHDIAKATLERLMGLCGAAPELAAVARQVLHWVTHGTGKLQLRGIDPFYLNHFPADLITDLVETHGLLLTEVFLPPVAELPKWLVACKDLERLSVPGFQGADLDALPFPILKLVEVGTPKKENLVVRMRPECAVWADDGADFDIARVDGDGTIVEYVAYDQDLNCRYSFDDGGRIVCTDIAAAMMMSWADHARADGTASDASDPVYRLDSAEGLAKLVKSDARLAAEKVKRHADHFHLHADELGRLLKHLGQEMHAKGQAHRLMMISTGGHMLTGWLRLGADGGFHMAVHDANAPGRVCSLEHLSAEELGKVSLQVLLQPTQHYNGQSPMCNVFVSADPRHVVNSPAGSLPVAPCDFLFFDPRLGGDPTLLVLTSHKPIAANVAEALEQGVLQPGTVAGMVRGTFTHGELPLAFSGIGYVGCLGKPGEFEALGRALLLCQRHGVITAGETLATLFTEPGYQWLAERPDDYEGDLPEGRSQSIALHTLRQGSPASVAALARVLARGVAEGLLDSAEVGRLWRETLKLARATADSPDIRKLIAENAWKNHLAGVMPQ